MIVCSHDNYKPLLLPPRTTMNEALVPSGAMTVLTAKLMGSSLATTVTPATRFW